MEGGEPKVIQNKEGNRTTPSVVSWIKNGERMVGLLAKRQAVRQLNSLDDRILSDIGVSRVDIESSVWAN